MKLVLHAEAPWSAFRTQRLHLKDVGGVGGQVDDLNKALVQDSYCVGGHIAFPFSFLQGAGLDGI